MKTWPKVLAVVAAIIVLAGCMLFGGSKARAATETKTATLLFVGYNLEFEVPTAWSVYYDSSQRPTTTPTARPKFTINSLRPLALVSVGPCNPIDANTVKLFASTDDITTLAAAGSGSNGTRTFTSHGLTIHEVTTWGGVTDSRTWVIHVPVSRITSDNPTITRDLASAAKTLVIKQEADYGNDPAFDHQLDRFIRSLRLTRLDGGAVYFK